MATTKGVSRTDLERKVVGSLPAAERVGEAMRLLPRILLREDPRVQRSYAEWWTRMLSAGAPTAEAVAIAMEGDFLQLRALVHELGLDQYASWLPKMLRCEFQREAEQRAFGGQIELEIHLAREAAAVGHGREAAKAKVRRSGRIPAGEHRAEHPLVLPV
jgi:hypothetical protein